MKLINDETKNKVITQSKEMVAKSQDNLDAAAKQIEKSLNKYVHKFSDVISSTFNDLYSASLDIVDYDLVSETKRDGKIIYSIDMPGVVLEDINISYLRNYVKVEAKRTDQYESSAINTDFTINQYVDPETAKASLKNGVLSISFDEIEELQTYKKINIE